MKNLYSRILALIIFIYFPIIGIFAQGSEVPGIISYSKTDTITSTTFSVVWPVPFPDNDYFLYIRAWTEEIVNGSTVQITNGIYNFSQTESGFSLNVKNADGYLSYLVVNNFSYTDQPGSQETYKNSFSIDQSYSGTTIEGTAGETLAFGDFIYFDFSFLKWKKASASAYTTARCKGISVSTMAQDSTGTILLEGTIRNDAWNWTASDVWLSTSAGQASNTPPSTTGEQILFIGTALDADILLFKPSNDIGEL